MKREYGCQYEQILKDENVLRMGMTNITNTSSRNICCCFDWADDAFPRGTGKAIQSMHQRQEHVQLGK